MKAFKSLFLGLGALVCASCTQQDEELGASLNRSPRERVTVTAGPILPTQTTRVTTERDGNVMHFNWEKGDAILLANSTQQLPYLSTAAGPSTLFVSALTGSESYRDYINGVGGEGAVYAYYPYNQGEKIDMATKTVRINQDEPFLYAIDTIQADTLNLHFHHAFAYIRLNFSTWGGDLQDKVSLSLGPDYLPLELEGCTFNFATREVEYSDYKDEMEWTVEQLADTSRLYPILPTTEGKYFKVTCQMGDSIEQDQYTYKVPIPKEGLQAGHVYQINIQFNTLQDMLAQFYKNTNGDQWKDNTNWLSGKPIGEWYGITTDDEGYITGIDLSDNNLVGKKVFFELPSTVTSFNINNNAIDRLELIAHGLQTLQLDNCIKERVSVDSINSIEITHCDSISDIHLGLGCKKLTVSDCYFRDGYMYSYEDLDEVNITNCTMEYYNIYSNILTFDNSQITRYIDGKAYNQLNIINSSIAGLYDYNFLNNTQINLQNATLINPQWKEGLTIPNVTKTLTGAEWSSFIDEYYQSYGLDYEFLRQLYNAGGASWTNNTNWMTDKPYNEWYGVTTDAEGHITGIDLSSNNLVGSLYLELPSTLTSFNINNNSIHDFCLIGHGQPSLQLDNCIKGVLSVENINSVEVTNCNSITGIETYYGCKKLTVRDCSFEFNDYSLPDGPQRVPETFIATIIDPSNPGYGEPLDEVVITNCSLDDCILNSALITIENTQIANRIITLYYNQFNITNSTIIGLSGYVFYNNIPINLQNVTLVSPEGMNGISYSNVTQTMTREDWVSLINEDYQNYQLLQRLYYDAGGKSWTNNTNWMTGTSWNEWYGVTTDDKGHITGIDLSNNNLVGSLDLELPSTLTSFNINNNSIKNLTLRGHGQPSVQLDNCIKGVLAVDSINTIEVTNCNSLERFDIGFGCKKLIVSNCYFQEDGVYITSEEEPLDEAIITNCTMKDCRIGSTLITIENTQITNRIDVSYYNQFNVTNSTITTLDSNDFYNDIPINLQNVTLVRPEYMYGITLPNVTQTMTSGELVSLTEKYDSDFNILCNLYYNTQDWWNNAQYWTNSTNWMTDTPWSEWYGITTDDEGHLIAIDLSENNLTGILDFRTQTNSYLTHLNLDKNKFATLVIANLKDFSLNENESEMERFEIYSVDSVKVSNCTIKSFKNYGQVCSLSNCTTNQIYIDIENLLISKGTYENVYGRAYNQLTVKDATLSLTNYSNLYVNDEADIVLENVTLKYGTDESTYTPVTVTKSLKGSEWQAFIKETFGIEDTGE